MIMLWPPAMRIEKTRIDSAIAREVIRDMEGGGDSGSSEKFGVMAAAAVAAVLCVSGTFMLDLSPLDVFSRQHRLPVFSAAAIKAPEQDLQAQVNGAGRRPSAVQEEVGGKRSSRQRGDQSCQTRRHDDQSGPRCVRRAGNQSGSPSSSRWCRETTRTSRTRAIILQGQQIFFPDVKHEPMEAPQ